MSETSPRPETKVLSGWCMTGHHRPGAQTVGCKEVFTTSVCPCPCHAPKAADDPQYDSPEPAIVKITTEEHQDV